MPTVTETLSLPDGTPPVRAKVFVWLVVPGYTDDDRTILSSQRITVDEEGVWEADLEANANITPANTHYLISRLGSEVLIVVPDSPGPHQLQDLLVDAPEDLDLNALAVHIAQVADPLGHLPAVAEGDAGKVPTVNEDEDGYELVAPAVADHPDLATHRDTLGLATQDELDDLALLVDGKAATGHDHDADYEASGAVTTHAGAADPHGDRAWATPLLAAKADLVGGKVPSSQLPAIATGEHVTVADLTARLALTAGQVQPGDVATQIDDSTRWLLLDADPSLAGSWLQLTHPADAVTSVNGETGVVVLSADDVGALEAADIGVSVQAHAAVLDATTAAFTAADEAKLDGIEAGADVSGVPDPSGEDDGRILEVAGGALVFADPAVSATLRVEDEGGTVVAAATGMNFAGASVTVTDAGSNEALVTILGGMLAETIYAPASLATYDSASTSFADVDATNLTLTFTPTGSQALIHLEAVVFSTSSTEINWNLRDAGGDIAGTGRRMGLTIAQSRVGTWIRLTGLTPGAAKTVKWGFARKSGSATCRMWAGDEATNMGPAIMRAWNV